MKCKNCGELQSEDARYCSSCGYPLKDIESPKLETIVEKERQWYYYDGEKTLGPMSEAELLHAVKSLQHLIWTEGMEDWICFGDSEFVSEQYTKQEKNENKHKLLNILTYATLGVLGVLCFIPLYYITDSSQLWRNETMYWMFADIGIYLILSLVIVAFGVFFKKYFVSFWMTLIIGLILYVRLFFVPSVEMLYDYYVVLYGIPLFIILLVYSFLFVLVSIMYYRSQKENLQNRYM